MPTLLKMVATPNTDRPMYQKNIDSRQVERGVHQRVGVAVQLATDVTEVDVLVAGEELTSPITQRSEVRLLHLPAPRDLLDDELRVAPHLHRARRRRRRRFESRDQRAVLGDV